MTKNGSNASQPKRHSIANRYQLIQKIGEGSYSEVFKVYDPETEQFLAAKMAFNEINHKQLVQESKILQKFDGQEEIIQQKKFLYKPYFEIFDPASGQFKTFSNQPQSVMLTELCDGCSLIDYLIQKQVLEDSEKKDFAKQILRAMQRLKEQGIAHRDLKPDNILIDQKDKKLKLIDFGLSMPDMSLSNNFMAGTPVYQAPEIRKRRKSYKPDKADIYSLGITLFSVICGRPPYSSISDEDDLYVALKNEDWSEFWYYHHGALDFSKESTDFRNLFQKMATQNPNERPSLEEVLDSQWAKSLNL